MPNYKYDAYVRMANKCTKKKRKIEYDVWMVVAKVLFKKIRAPSM